MPAKIGSEKLSESRGYDFPQENMYNITLFAKLIENSNDGIALLDRNFTVIYRSRSAERIHGWPENDRGLYKISDLVHPDDRGRVVQTLEDLLDLRDESITRHFRSRHSDGHYMWLECTFTNHLHDPDIAAIVCNYRDITQKKHDDENLVKNSLFIKTITDNVPAMIAYWSADLYCLFANKPYMEWFEKEPDEMIGLSKKALMDGREYEECATYINEVLKGRPQSFERKFVKDNGYKIDTQTRYIPDWDGKKVKGFYSLIYDISEIKLAQQEIKQKNEQIADILDNIAEGFAAFDRERRYTYVNKHIGQMTGHEPQDLIGKNVWEVFPETVGSPTYQAIETAFNENRHVFNEDYYEPLGLWQENRVYPTSNGVFMFVRDITEKKELQRLLHEANSLARIGGWEIDLEKKTVYWSEITQNIHKVATDYHPDIDEMIALYKEGESRQAMIAAMESATLYGTPADIELQLVTAKGNTIWVRVIMRAGFKAGKCTRLYGSIQDIDARKKAEIASVNALKERNTILESIGDAFFAVDNDWVVTYWNNMAEKVLHVPKDKILNNNLWEIFADATDTESYKRYHEAMRTGEATHFEDYYPTLNRWYEISGYPTDNGLSVYFKDITDRKLWETQLKELNKNLEKHAKELAISNAELEQFAYVASHDLQEPLRMVTSFLTQLEKKYSDVVDDKGRQYIYFAVDGAKRMRQIILDLLDFSRVGRTENDLEEIDLNKVVNEVCGLYHRQIEELGGAVEFQNLPKLTSYKTPIRQVFQNLIGNSLKYHSADRATRIEITSNETDSMVEIAVKDNGIGIAEEYFEKIFIIFQRLHNREEYSGTGMGLAIAKKIVENMGGKIWVESKEGEGTTFHFTLQKNIK